MRRSILALLAALSLSLAACTSPAASPGVSGPRTITVTALDELRFEPDHFTVKAGESVHFVVTNVGLVVHEFYIGDEAAQMTHEDEMRAGGMQHGDAAAIEIAPGETMTLDYAFDDPGELLIGCHEAGHYEGGMVATIEVQP